MKRLWTAAELAEHWTLLPGELALLGSKTGATRLGVALLLKAFHLDGRFPAGKHELSSAVIAHLARQVHVPALAFLEYDWQGRSITYHRTQSRALLGVREATAADAEVVGDWLVTPSLDRQQGLDGLKALAAERFRARKLESPASDRLAQVVRSALHRHELQLFAATLARLTPETIGRLDALLDTAPAPGGAGRRAGGEQRSLALGRAARRPRSGRASTSG